MNISLALALHSISVQASIFPLIADLVRVLGWSRRLAVYLRKDLELSFYMKEIVLSQRESMCF